MSLHRSPRSQAELGKEAAKELRLLSEAKKNAILNSVADKLRLRASEILKANEEDCKAASAEGKGRAFLERLELSESRIQSLAEGVRAVAALPDPVGKELSRTERPDGLLIQKVRVPIGVLAMIYESRPGVTIDAAALCFKSGNACILRSGKEASRSTAILTKLFRDSLREHSAPENAVQMLEDPTHEAVRELVQLEGLIDLVIPRGGEALIRSVVENARVPVLKHYKGVCHAFVDRNADPAKAEAIIINGKCQRPGVCNALETFLIEKTIAKNLLPRIANSLLSRGVELRGDPAVCALVPQARPATEADWDTEYLDLILSIRIVEDIDEAIQHIARYSSGHSEVIISDDAEAQQRFLNEVDSAAVFVNASTRLCDGGELGLGAEIGISTDKLHARGPMGLEELTSYQWRVIGAGHIRP